MALPLTSLWYVVKSIFPSAAGGGGPLGRLPQDVPETMTRGFASRAYGEAEEEVTVDDDNVISETERRRERYRDYKTEYHIVLNDLIVYT